MCSFLKNLFCYIFLDFFKNHSTIVNFWISIIIFFRSKYYSTYYSDFVNLNTGEISSKNEKLKVKVVFEYPNATILKCHALL